jgi:antitoxin component YwqK of YwqJK toxin-antitoxin module
MKKLFFISILTVSIQVAVAQKMDTIYYDANWKGVPVKTLASFMRIAHLSADSQLGTVKDFYITGELQTEGLIPVYIDKNDDKKSKFKGHVVSYYKSGKKQSEGFRNDSCQLEGVLTEYYENGFKKVEEIFKNGQQDGEQTNYYDNGLRRSKGVVKNNKWVGTFYQFNVDGSYAILEYSDGKPKDNYILVGVNGKRTKMKFNTKQ